MIEFDPVVIPRKAKAKAESKACVKLKKNRSRLKLTCILFEVTLRELFLDVSPYYSLIES
jgi:hypothetical protein